MKKKYKKHGYAERLKYMHMIEEGYSFSYIKKHYGIDSLLLKSLWKLYCLNGSLVLQKKRGRLPKVMGRPKKKKPEEMTALERLRYDNECLKAEVALLKK